MTTHKMTAYCPFGLQPDSIQVEIVYTYTAGSRATRIDPADPAEVDFVSARATLHTLDDTMAAMLSEWAQEHLADDSSAGGYHDACDKACDGAPTWAKKPPQKCGTCKHLRPRSNGQPLWFVRPIIDGVIREERGSVYAGTLAAMVQHISRLHRETGLEHAAAEVQP